MQDTTALIMHCNVLNCSFYVPRRLLQLCLVFVDMLFQN